MRRVFTFFVFVSLSLSIPSLAKRVTKGFRIQKICLEFPDHVEWETSYDPKIDELLNQTYSYFDKGAQCYVFLSEDQATVLKLFRYDRPASSSKVIHLFNAAKIAYDLLKDETGLLFVHLNPTKMNLPVLTCYDPIGRKVLLDLNCCRFALQKKVKPFQKTLLQAKDDPKQMRFLLDQFFELLSSRTKKGVMNSDPSLSRNFGFLDAQAVELDFGNYRIAENNFDRIKEIKRYSGKLKKWLTKHASEYVSYVEKKEDDLAMDLN